MTQNQTTAAVELALEEVKPLRTGAVSDGDVEIKDHHRQTATSEQEQSCGALMKVL